MLAWLLLYLFQHPIPGLASLVPLLAHTSEAATIVKLEAGRTDFAFFTDHNFSGHILQLLLHLFAFHSQLTEPVLVFVAFPHPGLEGVPWGAVLDFL